MLLGVGEGVLLQNEQRLRDLGFLIPGFTVAQLISYIRLVDDGSIASFVFCVECLHLFLCVVWNCVTVEEKLDVTVEEWGSREWERLPYATGDVLGRS